jgi:hypothetical protein
VDRGKHPGQRRSERPQLTSRHRRRAAAADKGGALATLAAQPGGRALLWAVTVALAMLVLWRLGEATVGLRWVQPRHKRIRKRVESAVTAVVFGLLAVSAGKLATPARRRRTGLLRGLLPVRRPLPPRLTPTHLRPGDNHHFGWLCHGRRDPLASGPPIPAGPGR